MAVFGAGLDIGLVLLLSLALVEYAKLKVPSMALKATSVGAVLYLLGGSLAATGLSIDVTTAVSALNILGTIAVVVGLLWAAVSLTSKLRIK